MTTKKLFRSVKGTRDFYPENWAFQTWLQDKFLSTGRLFGYQEYEAPVLEPIELYLEKSSQEILKEQTFTLTDRGGETLVMRPELTPSLARMVAQKENELIFPLRWQSYGRFWRYEKPQRGRGREFFQWNIDCFGSNSTESDAEMLTIAALSLKAIGISPADAKIKINDREGLENLLKQQLGLSNVKTIVKAIDKIDKLNPDDFKNWLIELGLNNNQTDTLTSLLNSTDTAFSPRIKSILELLPAEIKPYIEIDLKIVRGFDYYTGLVFEAWANTNLKRSLFGGGRYDKLTEQVGGTKAIPGIGFAIGDMPIYELLLELNKLPPLKSTPTQVLVAVFSPVEIPYSQQLATMLRANGINTETYSDATVKFSKQLKYANDKAIPYVAIIGPDETKNGQVTVKKLSDGSQQTTNQDKILELINK